MIGRVIKKNNNNQRINEVRQMKRVKYFSKRIEAGRTQNFVRLHE